MTTTTRRAVLAAAPAVAAGTLAAGAVAVAVTRATEVDPIFAVIRAHQADLEAMVHACDSGRGDEADFVTPDRWLLQVLTTQPTTIAGVAALLAHVGQPENLHDEPDPEDRESILSGVREANPELRDAGREFPKMVAAALRAIAAGRVA
jgi:hypothetical protein